jgi:hypothetical protein
MSYIHHLKPQYSWEIISSRLPSKTLQKPLALAKKTLSSPPIHPPSPSPLLSPGPNKKQTFQTALRFFIAALATASIAAALFFIFPPAALALTALTGWLLFSSIVFLLNKTLEKSDGPFAKSIRFLHAAITEIHSFAAAALLFPATHFPSYHAARGHLKGRPILLVNGYLSFGSTWHSLRSRLVQEGFGPIYTMNVGSFKSIPEYADQVREKVKTIKQATKRSDIALVCHSKGGLVGSYYATQMAKEDGIQVTDVITIGSPLAGTPIAKLGIGKDAKQMEPDDPFHKDLRKAIGNHPEIRFYHLASEMDEIVPLQSALIRTNQSQIKVFKDLGHLALVFSSKTADQVCSWLRSSQ